MAHITGGGFIENIPRVLPEGVNVDIEYGSWPILPIFNDAGAGNITNNDMFRRLIWALAWSLSLPADQADEALRIAGELGEEAYRIGTVTAGSRVVTFKGAVV